MAIPTPKIELGVDVNSPIAPFFRLDDLETGVLDSSLGILGGESVFFDITDKVKRYSISRGKGRQFSQFTTGQADIELNNHDRTFDPKYADSPLVGQIVPRREIRISSNDAVVFYGWVDDWNLSYLPNGDSIAQATCYDAFAILAGQTLTAGTPVEQLSSARIIDVLDDPLVNWSASNRNIDEGIITMGTQEITEGTNALSYLQKITQTEEGLLFISKDGDVTFKSKLRPINIDNVTTFGDSEGIPFRNLGVTYGSELLFNNVIAANVGGGTATVADVESQAAYGVRTYTATDLLGANDQVAIDYALSIAEQYSTPEYRFDSLEVALHKLESADRDKILALELGSIARIIFTPNGIGDAIGQYGEIVSIDHMVSPDQHIVELGFSKLSKAQLTLDDEIFGKLDLANVLGAANNAWTLNDAIYGRLSAGMAVS